MDIGVFAFIRDADGKVLFVQDVTREQKWTLPGGGLGFQELVPVCLEREVKEETSLDIKTGRLLGIFSQQKTPGIVILMAAEVIAGKPIPDGVETAEYRYFSLDELLAIKDTVKPAQLSMVWQVMKTTPEDIPLFNHFVPPDTETKITTS